LNRSISAGAPWRAGVKVGYRSDLLGELQDEQSRELVLRSELVSPIEIIRSATTIGAEIVAMSAASGIIEPGALADLLVVDDNPLQDLGLLQNQRAHLSPH
jgi:imidazolonepropionase-like amidohydrolase